MNYEHDQEKLLNTASQSFQTAVSAGAALWQARKIPVKIQVTTAKDDVQSARQRMQQGRSQSEIADSIRQGKPYQRLVEAGKDGFKYLQLIMRRAEIEQAVELMPASKALTKTPKKSLS